MVQCSNRYRLSLVFGCDWMERRRSGQEGWFAYNCKLVVDLRVEDATMVVIDVIDELIGCGCGCTTW